MKKLISPIFKATLHQRETKIFLGFILFPLLLWSLTLLPDGAFSLDLSPESSWLEFFSTSLMSQIQLVLPTVTLALAVIVNFNQDIHYKTLYLYKDIDRGKILGARLVTYLSLYALYFLGTLAMSGLVYGFLLKGNLITSLSLLPQTTASWSSALATLVSAISISLITIFVSSWLAMTSGQTTATVTSLLIIVLSNMEASLSVLGYLFPTHYLNNLAQIGFINVVLSTLAMTVAYCGFSTYLANKIYKELEL